MINVLNAVTCDTKGGGDGVNWKGVIVFDARKPLLLRGKKNFAILNQAGGAVMVEGRNPQDQGHCDDRYQSMVFCSPSCKEVLARDPKARRARDVSKRRFICPSGRLAFQRIFPRK